MKSSNVVIDNQISRASSLSRNLLRYCGGDVLEKYEVIDSIGIGSMGAIYKAKVKDDKIGGTAYSSNSSSNDVLSRCGCLGFFGGFSRRRSPSLTTIQMTTMEGSTHLCQSQRRKGEAFYALKTIIQKRIKDPVFIKELRNEIEILKTLDHPNIAKAYEVFANKIQIHIVLELCSGGDLYRRLPYSEEQAASITGKICSAIAYMHTNRVVHRDLKFENIMWESNESDEIKIIDFGLSKKFLPSEKFETMTEGVGTIYTMAPEVLKGDYTSQADLWSIGVISFMLLSSTKPFHHKKRNVVFNRILRCEYNKNFEGKEWDPITNDAKDFVSKLIVLDPEERYNAKQSLKHRWFQHKFNLSDRRPAEEYMQQVEKNLVRYGRNTSLFKKVALNVIAHKSTPEEICSLREVFDQFDSRNDGIVSYKEFQLALKESNYSEDEINDLFNSIDVNSNGHIVYTEFLAATIEVKGAIEEERIAEAFDRMDTDSSGFISPDNLRQLLGDGYSKKDVETIIKQADLTKDGKVSFEEFKTILKAQTERSIRAINECRNQ